MSMCDQAASTAHNDQKVLLLTSLYLLPLVSAAQCSVSTLLQICFCGPRYKWTCLDLSACDRAMLYCNWSIATTQ